MIRIAVACETCDWQPPGVGTILFNSESPAMPRWPPPTNRFLERILVHSWSSWESITEFCIFLTFFFVSRFRVCRVHPSRVKVLIKHAILIESIRGVEKIEDLNVRARALSGLCDVRRDRGRAPAGPRAAPCAQGAQQRAVAGAGAHTTSVGSRMGHV